MAQHYLASAASKDISLLDIAGWDDVETAVQFSLMRWAKNCGEPYCPGCGSTRIYDYRCRAVMKCADCKRQFSDTSGTIFASRKLDVKSMLMATMLFANAAKGYPALQLSRDLGVQYKTAFAFLHRLRGMILCDQARLRLSGVVEVDGGVFGGHTKYLNVSNGEKKRCRSRFGERRVIVVMRERGGRTITAAHKKESLGVQDVLERVEPGSVIMCDESRSWDCLAKFYSTLRIKHKERYVYQDIHTNMAESFFSRMRRSATVHQLISARYMPLYAAEMAWREDWRRRTNGQKWRELLRLCIEGGRRGNEL